MTISTILKLLTRGSILVWMIITSGKKLCIVCYDKSFVVLLAFSLSLSLTLYTFRCKVSKFEVLRHFNHSLGYVSNGTISTFFRAATQRYIE